jgi:hypothetical protein
MNKLELYEEIRALLREPQQATTSNPWNYTDTDFAPQVRSALRHMRAKGLTVVGVMDAAGQFSTAPTEREGMIIALFVADRLISGDLMQKLQDGELGVVFKTGSDLIDTKQAAREFSSTASAYRTEFQTLMAIALADGVNANSSVYSGTVPQSDEGPVDA